MRSDATAMERFQGWFVRSIEKLKELPEGDGAFAAMMIALPLYERYIIAKLKSERKPTGADDIRREMAQDLNLDDRGRKVFWSAFRNGFSHQAMAMAGATKWAVSDRFGELPEFNTVGSERYICLDPWKFADRVLKKFIDNPQLITNSEAFPFADVFYL